MRKLFVRIFIVVFVLYFILFGAGAFIYLKSRPTLKGQMQLKGLQGKVTVTRDQYGVPHIVAEKSDLDAFFVLGYVHAQDRFWQMEFNRRVAQGTLSEVLGENTLTADKYLRTWGFYKAAEKAWPALSPETKAVIQSYTDGVNAYINQKHFPLQFALLNYQPKPWTVIDSISWQKVMAWNLQTVWRSKIKNYLVEKNAGKNQISDLFPSYPNKAPLVLSDLDLKQSGLVGKSSTFNSFASAPDKGSNAWVISGKLTESGKPLLADDPHLELQSPSTWYLVELKGPGLHIEGATVPGLPMVVIGHNDNIAWGVTNVNPDVQDLYILDSNSPIKIRDEVIKIKNKPDFNFSVMESDVGPVMSTVSEAGQIGSPVALKWTALDPNDTTVQSMLEIDYAHNWNEFVSALKDFVVPSQNFVYADKEGNIGYYLPGKIPVRDWNTNLPIKDDKQHQWKSYIPFEKLPHVYNPPEGYLLTANNRVASNNYPYAINFRWSVPPYRAERITELLKEEKPLNIEKNELIQNDTVSLLWRSFSSELLNTKPLDKNCETALQYLKDWDGNASLDSIPQTIFAYWYRELGDITPSFVSELMPLPEPLYIEKQIKNNPELLSNSLEITMNKLIKDHGADPKNWNWGNIHHAVFKELAFGDVPGVNLLWNRSVSSRGSLYTVNTGIYDENNFNQIEGAGYRQIIDLNNFNHSVYIQSLGQSNDFISTHYQDLMPLWRDGKYLSMSSDENKWGDVKVLTLIP